MQTPQDAFVVTSGNVGIGTWTASSGALIVRVGNVGIGTSTPQDAFVVTSGNVGIGTWAPQGLLTVQSGNMIVQNGNVAKAYNPFWILFEFGKIQ